MRRLTLSLVAVLCITYANSMPMHNVSVHVHLEGLGKPGQHRVDSSNLSSVTNQNDSKSNVEESVSRTGAAGGGALLTAQSEVTLQHKPLKIKKSPPAATVIYTGSSDRELRERDSKTGRSSTKSKSKAKKPMRRLPVDADSLEAGELGAEDLVRQSSGSHKGAHSEAAVDNVVYGEADGDRLTGVSGASLKKPAHAGVDPEGKEPTKKKGKGKNRNSRLNQKKNVKHMPTVADDVKAANISSTAETNKRMSHGRVDKKATTTDDKGSVRNPDDEVEPKKSNKGIGAASAAEVTNASDTSASKSGANVTKGETPGKAKPIVSTADKPMDGAATDKAKSDGAATDKAKSDGAVSDKAKSDGAATDKAKSDGAATDKTKSDGAATDKTKSDGAVSDKAMSDGATTDKTKSDGAATDKTKSDGAATDRLITGGSTTAKSKPDTAETNKVNSSATTEKPKSDKATSVSGDDGDVSKSDEPVLKRKPSAEATPEKKKPATSKPKGKLGDKSLPAGPDADKDDIDPDAASKSEFPDKPIKKGPKSEDTVDTKPGDKKPAAYKPKGISPANYDSDMEFNRPKFNDKDRRPVLPISSDDNSKSGASKGDKDLESPVKFNKQLRGNKAKEDSGSNRFVIYLIVTIIAFGAVYILYHKKQKIVAFIVEGRRGGVRTGSRRTSSGSGSGSGYKPVPTDEQALLPPVGDKKPESVQNFIY